MSMLKVSPSSPKPRSRIRLSKRNGAVSDSPDKKRKILFPADWRGIFYPRAKNSAGSMGSSWQLTLKWTWEPITVSTRALSPA